MELREMLNDKRAQEVAILQSRHQLEWDRIKEQCLKEKEDLESKYQQELGIKSGEKVFSSCTGSCLGVELVCE